MRHPDLFKIVHFGALCKEKGSDLVLKLAKRISQQPEFNNITIDLYGSGDKFFIQDVVENITSQSPLAKVLTYRGFTSKPELLNQLSNYDLAILPLREDEPFAFSVLDAMSCGVAVIVGAQSGVAEFLEDQYDVIFMKDRNSVDDLWEQVQWCYQNPEALKEIRTHAFESLSNKFDLDRVIVPKLNEIIENIDIQPRHSFDSVLNFLDEFRYPPKDKPSPALQEAQTIIEAMKSSKFWKLRRLWFKVKSAVGYGLENAEIDLTNTEIDVRNTDID